MNRSILLSACLVIAHAGIAQSDRQFPDRKVVDKGVARTGATTHHATSRSVIWSDDFSNPSTWVRDHAPGSFNLDWQIGVGLQNTGQYPTAPIQSTTAANGYAMLDSDGASNTSPMEESARLTTATPIDLSGSEHVILEFENNYRKFPPEACYVVVSTDGNFPTLTTSTNISGMPNVFRLFANLATNSGTLNPERVSLDISSIAGGQSTVWIRFHWTGRYGYSWFVDDVTILDQEPYDLVLERSMISHTGEGEEYGRVPQDQLNPEMNFGAEVLNFGIQGQTGLSVRVHVTNAASATVLDQTFPLGDLAAGAAATLDELVTLPSLAEGIYDVSFTVTSNEAASESNTGNNTVVRQFAIDNDVYALDGIDVYDDNLFSAMGSNSFEGAADGLEVMTFYEIVTPTTVYGVSAELANGTEVNSAVIVSIHDLANVANDNLNSPIAVSDVVTVTAANLAAGRVTGTFDTPANLLPGQYFAAVRLFSTGNQNEILVLDDITVEQPDAASLIYDPSDATVYANGNALAVRLLLDPSIGMGERSVLEGVTLSPNPTNGVLRVNTTGTGLHTVEVMDPLGKVVSADRFSGNTTIDLSAMAKGIYLVRVSNAAGSAEQRVAVE